MTHVCVNGLVIIVSANGLSSPRRQTIIWTNDTYLLNGFPEMYFSVILVHPEKWRIFMCQYPFISITGWFPIYVCKESEILIRQWMITKFTPYMYICYE